MSEGSPRSNFDATPGSTHNLLVGLIPRGARVLEIGCASGYIAEALKARLGCSVTGIELSAEAARLARVHCDRVVVGDAESLQLEALLGGTRFDAVLFADVLEHLRDPARLLRRVRALLADGGAVLASIPNVAHGSVRLALLGGEFRYGDFGLLDRTHLRFFTRETVQDLFEESGFLISDWLRRSLPIDQSEVGPPARALPPGVLEWLATDPEATTYQFVIRAVPSEAAATVHQLRGEAERVRRAQQWKDRCRQAVRALATVIRPGEPFILIDEDRIRAEVGPDHRALPFPEQGGKYWGPPSDDASAIQELERLRSAGARFAVIAWPAFWWLEFYAELERHLSQTYPNVLNTDSLRVYDLRPSVRELDGG